MVENQHSSTSTSPRPETRFVVEDWVIGGLPKAQ
jgi:hypothetical protein